VSNEQSHLIRGALEQYLGRADPREAIYQALAKRYALLPILPEWTGFVGLREDGVLFWVSEADGSVSADINEHALHLAKIRGPELFPELGFLRPVAAVDWVQCWSCGGAGRVEVQGQVADNLRCLCGGMGQLPSHLADLLREKAQ
jgi:hypothetical protein